MRLRVGVFVYKNETKNAHRKNKNDARQKLLETNLS